MKILCVMWHPEYVLRLYEPALRLLAQAGHTLHLGFTNPDSIHQHDELRAAMKSLGDEYTNVTFGTLPSRRDLWTSLLEQVRGVRFVLKFCHSRFDEAPDIRERSFEELYRPLQWLMRRSFIRGPKVLAWLDRLMQKIEAALPADRRTRDAIAAHRPDLVFVTPVVHPPAKHTDYLKSSLAMDLPTVVGVASWDNLTSKGIVQLQPDSAIVWNEKQRIEAAEIHGLDPERISVTGAQVYDSWFAQRPSVDRETFCERIGLDPRYPVLLYLCSSRFLQGDERDYIRNYLSQLRSSSHPQLSKAAVVIRPYPTASEKLFADFDLCEFGNAVVWPNRGQAPILPEAKANYFDSLYHSFAVVAANTSGLIEAGVAGRRSFSILAPEFAKKQRGMPHFRYLLDSGFLSTAESMDEHLAQLAQEIDDAQGCGSRTEEFLSSFIRPHGLDRPAAPFVVEAIEGAATAPRVAREPVTARHRLTRLALAPPAIVCRTIGVVQDTVAWIKSRPRLKALRHAYNKRKQKPVTAAPKPSATKPSAEVPKRRAA